MKRSQQPLFARVWRLVATTACLATAVSSVVAAQETNTGESLTFIGENTLVVVRIDIQDVAFPEAFEQAPVSAAAHNAKQTLQSRLESLRIMLGDAPIFIRLDMPTNPSRVPLVVLVPVRVGLDPQQLNSLLGFETKPKKVGMYWQFVPSSAVAPTAASELSRAGQTEVATAFQAAFAAVDAAPIQIASVPPKHVYRTFSELLTELPQVLGGGPVSLITEGLQSAAVAIETKDFSFSARIQSASPAAAKALAERLPIVARNLLPRLLTTGSQDVEFAQTIADTVVKHSNITTADNLILARFDGSGEGQPGSVVISQIVKQLAGPIGRQAKMKRFKQIGLAIHNYLSANKELPPKQSLRNADGKSGLSWRVHILPYLGEVDLYNRFALDEPWDSPANIKLLDEMPEAFSVYPSNWLVPPDVRPGYTLVQAPLGEATIFGSSEAITLGNITDGTSSTLFTVEVAPTQAVPWTSPQDYQFDRDHPGAGLADEAGGFVAGMADGSVHFLSKDLPPETLLRLFEMNDGEVVSW